MLSRYPVTSVSTADVETMNNVNEYDDVEVMPVDYRVISTYQREDVNLRAILRRREPGYSIRYLGNSSVAFLHNKIFLSPLLVPRIIQWYHETLNHPGIARTLKSISAHFIAPGLKAQVEHLVSHCQVCKKNKRSSPKYCKLPPTLATVQHEPWQCVHVDLFGPWTFTDVNGKEHSLRGITMIDSCLRWIEIKPYDDKRSETVAMIFDREWLCRYPRPTWVVHDNGTEFTSEWTELLNSYGIVGRPTTIKNPQSNGLVERPHQSIAEALRCMQLQNRPFDETSEDSIFQAVAWGLRTAYHSTLDATPGQVAFGRDMVLNTSYLANWHHIRERRRKQVLYNNARENCSRIKYDYAPGQQVYVTDTNVKRKLTSKHGPFRIIATHCNGTVTIQRTPNHTERINVRRLTPA